MKNLHKQVTLILVYVLLAIHVNGQPLRFYQGGWKTNGISTVSKITATDFITAKVFRISCIEIVDAKIAEFQIIADGVPVSAVLQEGSSVFVEAKSVLIKQVSAGTFMIGNWEIVMTEDKPFDKAAWKAFPVVNKKEIIGSFLKPMEFVLSVNLSSSGCTDGRMVVYIDDVPVKNSAGVVMEFMEGSSIVGTGKKIEVELKGNCTPGNGIYGDVKFSNK